MISAKCCVLLLTFAVLVLSLAASLGLAVRSHHTSQDHLQDGSDDAIKHCTADTDTTLESVFGTLSNAKIDTMETFIDVHLHSTSEFVNQLKLILSGYSHAELDDLSVYEPLYPFLWSAWKDNYFDVCTIANVNGVGFYITTDPPVLAITNSTHTTIGTIGKYGKYLESDCNSTALSSGSPTGPCTQPAKSLVPVITHVLQHPSDTNIWSDIPHVEGHIGTTLEVNFKGFNSPVTSVGISVSSNFEYIIDLCKEEVKDTVDGRVFVATRHSQELLASSHVSYQTVQGTNPFTGTATVNHVPYVASQSSDLPTRHLAEYIFGNLTYVLSTTQTLRLDIVGVTYLLRVSEVLREDLDLIICFAEPRSEVVSGFTAEHAQTYAMDATALIVAPVVMLLLMCVMVMGTMKLVQPLIELSSAMENVAMMQLEGAKDFKHTSILTEVNSMQESFKSMVDSIKEFSEFLPSALVLRNDTTDDEARRSDGSKSENSRSTKGHSANKSSSKVTVVSGADSLKCVMKLKLCQKSKVVQVVLGMANFDKYLKETCACKEDLAELTEFHTHYIHLVLHEAGNNQGSLVRFQADEALVDFKGVVQCGPATDKAARFCLSVAKEYGKVCYHAHQSLHMGAGYGNCFVGNMGVEHLKAMSVLGDAYHAAKVMQCVAKEQGHSVIVSKGLSDKVQDVYVSLPVDLVKISGRPVQAHVLAEKTTSENSWMENNTQLLEYHKAWDCVLSGDLSDAVALFRALITSDGSEPVVTATARLVMAHLQHYQKQLQILSITHSPKPCTYLKSYNDTITIPSSVLDYSDPQASPNTPYAYLPVSVSSEPRSVPTATLTG
eukprot:TRINITY_DN5283_c0_g1_i1.p1 TRINITY_DN5283_c0_g1~~TRINITY_DN5283_c0_g1_i1.p1  ORF type:complete len:866 (+),score=235.74 TRINITY_DN5283_c0_g1_i1:96-2600(+)